MLFIFIFLSLYSSLYYGLREPWNSSQTDPTFKKSHPKVLTSSIVFSTLHETMHLPTFPANFLPKPPPQPPPQIRQWPPLQGTSLLQGGNEHGLPMRSLQLSGKAKLAQTLPLLPSRPLLPTMASLYAPARKKPPVSTAKKPPADVDGNLQPPTMKRVTTSVAPKPKAPPVLTALETGPPIKSLKPTTMDPSFAAVTGKPATTCQTNIDFPHFVRHPIWPDTVLQLWKESRQLQQQQQKPHNTNRHWTTTFYLKVPHPLP